MADNPNPKSPRAEKEEEVLAFWKERDIFKKTLQKPSPKGEFVFYEGPPTANGRPGIHHIEARSFKDIIPRFRTMQGYHVRRKAGWDTHGLPVELEVEKELGIKSKKEIEEYGIAAFNKKCKENVWKYVDEWGKFTERMGYWVDFSDAYITYDPKYMESLWSIVGEANKKGILYKDYKVLPWCARCGTALSSHELAQGYKEVKDLSLTAKFKIVDAEKHDFPTNTYFLAWTTTPWTLPGNVALAVGTKIKYGVYEKDGEHFILAKDLATKHGFEKSEKEVSGKELVGIRYEPLFAMAPALASDSEKPKFEKAYQVYAADFVTTVDGTGIVHTAVMYGQDDFELGTKEGLPKVHLVGADGKFIKGTDYFEGRFVRDEDVAVDILKDLTKRGLFFSKEKYEHTYPHCWRCKTPLIYFAHDSWYFRMQDLKEKMLAENAEINWEPSHIKEGRFGEWLGGVKDWAISRERYWGTPLPLWLSEDKKELLVVDSIATLKKHTKKSGNTYFVMRHGRAESNQSGYVSSRIDAPNPLTEEGRADVEKHAEELKKAGGVDIIVASPFVRTRQTAEITARVLGIPEAEIMFDERLGEINFGEFDGKPIGEYHTYFASVDEKFTKRPKGGENWTDVKRRVGTKLYELERDWSDKKILIVTHDSPILHLFSVADGLNCDECIAQKKEVGGEYVKTGSWRALPFVPLPHNEDFELDLHRPYVDDVVLFSEKGTELRRTKEVMDVWFDSGAMPFAQDHYPFENKEHVESVGYPADYISEAIDQTRGWFYTLHAVGAIMGRGKAYKNVICLGHILDKDGKKMSKSVGNVVNPWDMMEKYGVDPLRFWMYAINAPGESKNFDEKTVDEQVKKVFNLAENIAKFYEMYAEKSTGADPLESPHVLDQWLLALLEELRASVSKDLETYHVDSAMRRIRDFIGDFSQWYVRRSRDRLKGDDKDAEYAAGTMRFALIGLAVLMAPATPFFAEWLFQKVRYPEDPESVHLTGWPEGQFVTDLSMLPVMEETRRVVSFALEARAKTGIKTRQPLSLLTIKTESKSVQEDARIRALIAEELNVKAVAFNDAQTEVAVLDTTITPELKEEGDLRDLIRAVQEERKNNTLSQGDRITLTIAGPKEMIAVAEKYKTSLMQATGADAVTVSESATLQITIEKK